VSEYTSVSECTFMYQEYIIYTRLTHLVGEFTTCRSGAKPQRLLNEGASHTIECMCIAHGEVINAIPT